MTDPFPRLPPRSEPTPEGVIAGGLLPPIPDFTAVSTGVGHQMQFTSTSVDLDGTIVTYTYDFGDTVSGGGSPTADFRFSINGLVVTFTDTSTDVSPGTITGRSWAFGDNGSSTQQNPPHTYASAGSYSVTLTVTDNEGNTATRTRTVNLASSTTGRVFGVQGAWSGRAAASNVLGFFNLLSGPDDPSNIIDRIDYARRNGMKIKLIMTGGPHSNYLGTDGRFSLQRWKDRLDLFNTVLIRQAIAEGVDDGTIWGFEMIDEPGNTSAAKGWGGAEGVQGISKATLDEMAAYSHSIFPTLPAGIWNPRELTLLNDPATYQVVDFAIDTYLWRKGSIGPWITAAVAFANAHNLPVVLGINPLNGGFKPSQFPTITVASPGAGVGLTSIPIVGTLGKPLYDNDVIYFDNSAFRMARLNGDHAASVTSLTVDALTVALSAGLVATLNPGGVPTCNRPLTGGSGTSEVTSSLNCAMTEDQYDEWGTQLLQAAPGGMIVWKYATGYMGDAENKASETHMLTVAGGLGGVRASRRI